MAAQKMKIKALWSWCRQEYELGKRAIHVASFDDDVRANWCYKVPHKEGTKEGQATAENSKAIAEQQTNNSKIKIWPMVRRFMEAYLYKQKNANGIPWSYVFCIDVDKTDPVPTESQDFWETPLSGDQFHYDIK